VGADHDVAGSLLNRDIAVIFRDDVPLTQAGKDLVDAIAIAGLEIGDGSALTSEQAPLS